MPPKTCNQNKRSGRMAKKGGQVVLQEEVNNNEDWTKMLEKPGLYVVGVYTEWCGPCVPMVANLKKIKLELGNENLHYAIAKSDYINDLERFRQKSEPHWMFFFDGKLVNLIIDANAPRLMNLITDEVNNYEKFKKGEIKREFIPLNKITEEERRKMIEIEQYQKQKMDKVNKIRDMRMKNAREHALKQFTIHVQTQTCIVFFPHTIEYVMVEKPPEEGMKQLEEPPEDPVMEERMVCELARTCALNYKELIAIEAKEVQLTEDTLNEMFFADNDVLESFPRSLVDELLSKKVYSVILSLPKGIGDPATDEAVVDDENPPEPVDMMGMIEYKMGELIYGNGDHLNPTSDSIAVKNVIESESGEKIPSLYTPTNPLSKVSALAVLFKNFCANNGYDEPQPPQPQYLVIFDIDKSNAVLPIIEDLEDKIVHYGFFRSADPEHPRLLCKDPELLITYGMDKIGDEAKLVLSVLKDDNDKSLMRFVDVGPIYVSPDPDLGIDDANKYFPYNFDQMDEEVKAWLAADEEAAAADEEAAAAAADGYEAGGEEHELGEEETMDDEQFDGGADAQQ